MRIGIDVGGTNTDAVIISDEGRLLSAAKQPTSHDIVSGIEQVTAAVLREASLGAEQIKGIFVGTTHVLNALYHGKGITDTALVRICAYPSAVKAGLGWPDHLLKHLKTVQQFSGGYDLDGHRRNHLLQREQREGLIAKLRESNCRAVAIVGTFSPLYGEEENQIAELIQRHLPDLTITMSNQIGSLGFLERENATLLNAMLSNVMKDAIDGLSKLFQGLGFHCPYWFIQNDGSIMSLEKAAAFPVLTIGSGVANSLRGASYLTGLQDCLVVDMGGSTTEVGLVRKGEPQEMRRHSKLATIKVNVRLPKATSLPFGGESQLTLAETEETIGKLTDVFLQLSPGKFHDYDRTLLVSDSVSMQKLEQLVKSVVDTLRETIDRTQPVKEELPIVLVGGGSPLLVDRLFYKYGQIIHPPGFQICNAVGACMAPVSAQIDRIYWLHNRSKEEVLEQVKLEVIEEAVKSGGIHETIRLVQIEEIPFDYFKGKVIRFRLKAVGQLAL